MQLENQNSALLAALLFMAGALGLDRNQHNPMRGYRG